MLQFVANLSPGMLGRGSLSPRMISESERLLRNFGVLLMVPRVRQCGGGAEPTEPAA